MNHASEEQKNSLLGQILGFLQKNHILIPPQEHKEHHSAILHDINFTLINGWANPLLNRVLGNPIIHTLLFE
jgi:hypothetical protein